MSNTPAEYIVWIDCEMTGLDVAVHGLTEVAVIITDFALSPVDPGISLVINPGSAVLAQMDDFVKNMHEESGLLPQIKNGLSLAAAEQQLIEYLGRFIPAGEKPLVAGNTIGMDRRFISRYLPAFDDLLHYRSIDVSTIKELARRWYEPAFWAAPAKQGGHRALADIAESIQELAYFRDTVMVATPGPEQPEAQRVSERIAEAYAPFVQAG